MLYLLLALLSCTDYTMTGKPLKQDILAFPEHIDFGHLVSGQETGLAEFAIINSGQVDLIIDTPVLVTSDGRFSLGNLPEQQWIIPPGEHVSFEVSYNPQTFEDNEARIEVTSNDPDEPLVTVSLEGNGDAPVMTLKPSEFDYGDISIGCDNEERITITNDGNMDLIIDSVTQMVTQPADIIMEFGSLPPPPWVIAPGLSLDFLVSYIPTDIGSDESQIEIKSNDPANPEETVVQFGDGDVEQWFRETHLQEEIPILDILWVVDDSGSMNMFQTNLSSNIGLFVQTFIATGADYRMAVITTTHSMIGAIIDWNTPSPELAIASEVMVGIYGHGMEYGIDKSVEALNDPLSAGPGGAFFRENATLVVIYVSDEPNHGANWSTHVPFFDNLKAPGMFIPYAVIGDPPSGCSIPPRTNAMYGAGYWDIVNHYGGQWYSICSSDWGVQLQMMANALTGRRSFGLEEEDPIEDTITVTVNGQLVTDWEYNPNDNSIRFGDDSIPEAGQTIEIDYAVWGC